MGFDVTLVDASAKKESNVCPHCHLILDTPLQTEEGIRLCKGCLEEIKIKPGGRCNCCDVTVKEGQYYPDRAALREVNAILVFCRHKKFGCGWQGRLEMYKSHVAGCEFAGVSCPNTGCCEMVLASQLQSHLAQCLYRPVTCTHCQEKLVAKDLEGHHSSSCRMYPVDCERCGERVGHRHLLNHHLQHSCRLEECLVCNSLGVGVTATLPDVVPTILPWDESGPHEWNYGGTSLWHNGRKLSSGLPDLDYLKPQQRVGLLLTASGDLHVFIDRRHVKKVASGLPVNDHLWGAVDVFNKCSKIKSELLSVSGSRPTLPQLLTMDLPLRVGDRFETFGVLLLDDETGDKMAIMKEKFMRDPEKITMEVLREWLTGKGVEVSWESLIATLRNSRLKPMADQIQIALDQLRS